MYKNKFLISVIGLFIIVSVLSAKDYQASMFGIKSDGMTLNTRSIQQAIDFISEQGGGRLVFYVGRYLTGSVELKSNVVIRIEEGAVLVAVPSVYDFKGVEGHTALIYAEKQQNTGIGGKGVIEGNGDAVKASVDEQMQKGYLKGDVSAYVPSLIYLKDCENVQMEQLILQHAGNTSIVYENCRNVSLSDLIVNNQTTGKKAVSVSGCENLKMTNCYFDTTVTPLESTGDSQNLTFIKCITPDGNPVSCDK
ncbi:glycosyl hydrolase family 28 protein [Parabacteroides sp. Marseille-P3160]|uniref:glycosyl hydrolase family 28 protein n=1 Tax=Parabacteroides sp. Marseille-P3160 TaxID=1917887 RepID=UPI0009BA5815|nr:glycosyl hydrolase family 28 protein [Parabacteroides sp. Marseille-P3160]